MRRHTRLNGFDMFHTVVVLGVVGLFLLLGFAVYWDITAPRSGIIINKQFVAAHSECSWDFNLDTMVWDNVPDQWIITFVAENKRTNTAKVTPEVYESYNKGDWFDMDGGQ